MSAAQITKEKFVDRLIRSQLLSSDEVAKCEAYIGSVETATDAQSYARALVSAGKLTRFQALERIQPARWRKIDDGVDSSRRVPNGLERRGTG